jgi:hypothetical protein
MRHKQPWGGLDRHVYPHLIPSSTRDASVRVMGSLPQGANRVRVAPHHTTTTHSRSSFLGQGTGAMLVHLGGVAAATARRGEVGPAVAGYARPAADAHQPAVAALALAASALPQLIWVRSSSSWHSREECHNIEAQRQEDARAACRHARPGADPTWTSYLFDGGCLAFTDALHCVLWPRKFRPAGITFKYDGSMDPHEFLQVYTTAMEIAEGGDPT